MAATVVAVMRLPLAASVIALLPTASTGLQATPLIITAVVVGYVIGEVIKGWFLENNETPTAPSDTPT